MANKRGLLFDEETALSLIAEISLAEDRSQRELADTLSKLLVSMHHAEEHAANQATESHDQGI